MRLDKIKMSGFKSFVNPTTIQFPSNLIGIVGPNGCGKSNVIDAVRWVMGELSAKQLRGESATDVIFNGSRDRKPIGQASVELIFDNSEGKLGGEYAKFSEIALRREVMRDAQSTYYINGTKCRRRDIIDVFFGTGLGPRSYAVIEQDMISRFIEAKPEELRIYLEEVAGISKYKERRKETESRIHRTRENLSRINDIREELETQLARLKRQSRAAERYKVLKEEERLLKAQQLALRWRGLDQEINQYNLVIGERQNALEAEKAKLQHIDTEVEKAQTIKTDLNDNCQEIQTRFYEISGEITRIEQAIQHQKERHQQLEVDLEETEQTWQEAKKSLAEDRSKTSELEEMISALTPELEASQKILEKSQEKLHLAEEKMREWQQDWEQFNERAAHATKVAELQQANIQHLEQTQARAHEQLVKIDREKQQANHQDDLQKHLDSLLQMVNDSRQQTDQSREALTQIIANLDRQRADNQTLEDQFNNLKNELQEKRERFISLEALQQGALGQRDDHLIEWLKQHRLHHKPRLAQALQVDQGWEKACEVVLGSYLEAVCVNDVDDVTHILSSLENGTITLFDQKTFSSKVSSKSKGTLLNSKIKSSWPVQNILNGIYVVDSLDDALSMRDRLEINESVVTRGGIWVGKNWLRVSTGETQTTGVLEREQELRDVKSAIVMKEQLIKKAEVNLANGEDALNTLKRKRAEEKEKLSKLETQYAESNAKLEILQSQAEQIRHRNKRLSEELKEQHSHIEQATAGLEKANRLWREATEAIEENTVKRETMLQKRDIIRDELENAKREMQKDKEALHQLELKSSASHTQLTAIKNSIERSQKQIAILQSKRDHLTNNLSHDDQPIEQLEANLNESLEKQIEVKRELTEARQKLEAVEESIQGFLKARHEAEQLVSEARTALEEKRLAGQEYKVRQTTLQEQLTESSFDLEKLLQTLTEEATEAEWIEKLEAMARRISRLGPINLAAIEEYEQCQERKTYLDSQNADLEEALNTLQNAIRRIDRETRSRFKDTFDRVNTKFQELFPKVFGGGSAYLELTGTDLLDTGVALMARPPGKRITNIHLLSGGEKALTAIALVFSLFQLNPAPFCLLDEVDAPLDDTNVGRFCDLVSEMSKQIQFIFISHNKNAIQMANHLMGVTMHEPGVSRMVAVDVDAAVSMAEA